MKTCTKCRIEKQEEEFYKDRQKKDGLRYECKNCLKKYHKENQEKNRNRQKIYNKKNKEAISKKQKEYREKNKEKLKQQYKEYCKENREKINKQRNEYKKKRRKTDPNFKIAHILRVRNTRGIISRGGIKSDSSQKLLGCTWEEARIHIENQFTDGMSWENHGKWEIDHIRPMASFDLTDPEQQRQCCHYTNLRPLWA
jgi:exonuclease VII large subunit